MGKKKLPRFILAFDPSLDGCGYAVLDCLNKKPKLAEKGVVKGRTTTWGNTPTNVKLALITAKAMELRAKYDPIYSKVFLERGFSLRNNDTQATYRARGALETALVGLEIVEFTPNAIKKGVAGHGHASKEEVLQAVANIFNMSVDEFDNDNESDAVAVAYMGYINHYVKERDGGAES